MVALGRVEHMSEVMTNWNFAKGKRTGNKAYFIIACHTMHLTELFTQKKILPDKRGFALRPFWLEFSSSQLFWNADGAINLVSD